MADKVFTRKRKLGLMPSEISRMKRIIATRGTRKPAYLCITRISRYARFLHGLENGKRGTVFFARTTLDVADSFRAVQVVVQLKYFKERDFVVLNL